MSKRAKKNEQEAGDGDHDNGTGETIDVSCFLRILHLTCIMSEAEQNTNKNTVTPVSLPLLFSLSPYSSRCQERKEGQGTRGSHSVQ